MSSNRGVVTSNPATSKLRRSTFRRCSSGGKDDRPRRHSQGRNDEYLRLRPAHGSGRTTAPRTRDHRRSDREGPDVEYLEIGDLVSVPFNVACGPLPDLSPKATPASALTVNSDCAGGAYGYVDMGGWIGGQAEYVMAPYAGFNLLKIPDKAQAMEKIRDLTCFPIFCRRIPWSLTPRSASIEGLRRRRRAVGLATASVPRILGAAASGDRDMNHERLPRPIRFIKVR